MNRIDKLFKNLKQQGKKAFIVYITGGYPRMSATEGLVLALERSGVDLVEIGIPFSDPIADGPVIQHASEKALAGGATLAKLLKVVKDIRRKSAIPIVFMSYYNPIYKYGVKDFVNSAAQAGADGVIVPDLPPEEGTFLLSAAKSKNFHVILLASPTSTAARLKDIAKRSRGFIYYVSLTGVTGTRKSLSPDIRENIRKIKSLTDKPVCAGFGVSDEKQARLVASIADGVIVGSAVIKVMERSSLNRPLLKVAGRFTQRLGKAVHSV